MIKPRSEAVVLRKWPGWKVRTTVTASSRGITPPRQLPAGRDDGDLRGGVALPSRPQGRCPLAHARFQHVFRRRLPFSCLRKGVSRNVLAAMLCSRVAFFRRATNARPPTAPVPIFVPACDQGPAAANEGRGARSPRVLFARRRPRWRLQIVERLAPAIIRFDVGARPRLSMRSRPPFLLNPPAPHPSPPPPPRPPVHSPTRHD